MFERFTDRARRGVILAQDEARLAGHDQVCTGHLRAGMRAEGEAIAFRRLPALGAALLLHRMSCERWALLAVLCPDCCRVIGECPMRRAIERLPVEARGKAGDDG